MAYSGPPVGEETPPRVSFGPRAVWLLIALFAVLVALFAAWTYLQWSIAQHVFSTKSDLSWFGITFYHGYTFLVGGILALLVVNPRPGKSDLSGLFTLMTRRTAQYGDEIQRPLATLRPGAWVWGMWQFVKWVLVFGFFVFNDSFPTLGPIMNSVAMLSQGIGTWADIPRLLALPFLPASGDQLISLMPTMEVQFNLVYYFVSAFLTVFAVRMILRLLKNLTTRGTHVWLRNILAVAVAIAIGVVLSGPYWYMNAATPYLYGVSLVVLAALLFGYSYFGKRRDSLFPSGGLYRGIAIVLIALLVIQSGALAFLYFNWNNNYVPYQFDPGIQKQITVTRWAAGIQNIVDGSVTSLPTSNSSTILDVVRQWDQTAATVTNTKAIGAYNWMALGSSEIVFLNGTEYWVSPTTPAYPATDWISEHLIYTHAAKILAINTYNGSEVPVTSAYGVPAAPPIYYGEGPGFLNDVYVHVPGYDEIGNASYAGAPDYTLSGWQKAMWMLFAEGQVGFAFSGTNMQMLWNRNVFDRVQSVLIPGLVEDPAAYLVSDGTNIYYCVQVYIDYPLQSGFAASPYLRFFGVALVNVANGGMQFYNVSNLVGTNSSDFVSSFYSNYYSAWQPPPAWLVPQLRYPEQLLGTQTVPGQLDVDFQYHVSNPFIWRSGSQFYQRPTTTSNGTVQPVGVQYIPWAVGNKTYFAATQLVHYQNAASQNLAGMYIAYGGDRLGQIYLYQNPSNSTTIIGPSAAENALTTNQQVRTELTLLPNNRFGSYLLYSVGGVLTYFVAVYTNPGASGVVTQLPFMTAISPTTDLVGIGPNATAAYQNLLAAEAGAASSGQGNGIPGLNTTTTTSSTTSSTTTTSRVTIASSTSQQLLAGISGLAQSSGLSVVSATTVSPNVFINTATVSLSKVGVSGALSQVGTLIEEYGPGSAGSSVYVWTDTSGAMNVGLFQLKGGVTDLYYVSIEP
ncbi:MAG: hypothetical protein JRN58_09805 [Nitrososphaerota archaeon]|nr:hypothetical protein [Nitrososphaerota archaeon]MDG6967611.1 hypothetical protein [Nitrososphaerota archaeon]MDG6979360.1 hypothetical protein [Nitrososphaerota archaeon]